MPASPIEPVDRSVHSHLRAAQDTALWSPAVAFFSSPMLQKQPNAGRQARLEAAARHERRLEGVACTPWLGWLRRYAAVPPQGTAKTERISQPSNSGAFP